MSDYRVDIKVRNNNILKKLAECGYSSVGEFCRLNDKKGWASSIGELVNMKRSPLDAQGNFIAIVNHMCDLLRCSPEDLFSDVQMTTAIDSNKRTIEVNEAEMRFMLENNSEPMFLEDQMDKDRLPSKIEELLSTLTPREAKVVSMRFGLGEYSHVHTLQEVAQSQNVNRERIRQIEAKALRKLRHPSRSEPLRDYIEQ